LLIRGQLPAAPEGAEFLKRELYHGAFVRRLSFNVPVDADKIEAHFHNGLLTLSIPKAEAIKPKQIKIQTSK
jgi:HSP20 family protein